MLKLRSNRSVIFMLSLNEIQNLGNEKNYKEAKSFFKKTMKIRHDYKKHYFSIFGILFFFFSICLTFLEINSSEALFFNIFSSFFGAILFGIIPCDIFIKYKKKKKKNKLYFLKNILFSGNFSTINSKDVDLFSEEFKKYNQKTQYIFKKSQIYLSEKSSKNTLLWHYINNNDKEILKKNKNQIISIIKTLKEENQVKIIQYFENKIFNKEEDTTDTIINRLNSNDHKSVIKNGNDIVIKSI